MPIAAESYQWRDEYVTSIRLVCWWREHSALFFVLMDVYVNDVILFINTINWDINNYCDQLIREILEHIISASHYVCPTYKQSNILAANKIASFLTDISGNVWLQSRS